MIKVFNKPKSNFFPPVSTNAFSVFYNTIWVIYHCLNLFLISKELINMIPIDIKIGNMVSPQLINPLNKCACIATTTIEVGNIDKISPIEVGKKLSSIIRPLPNKVKKNKIITDRKKVADLSESIDMVINIFPKTKIKIIK